MEIFSSNEKFSLASTALAAVLACGFAAPAFVSAQEDELVFGGWGGPEEQIEEEVEEAVTEEVEETVAEVTEDVIEETVEDEIIEQVEDDVDELVFGGWGGSDDRIEEQIEESVAEQLEDQAGEQIQETIEDDLIDKTEEQVAQDVTEDVEESVESSVDEEVEESLAENVEDSVEENVETQVEESVQEEVAQDVESSVEDTVEETVQEEVAENVEGTLEDTVEESVQEEVAENVEGSMEDSVEQGVEGDVEEVVEVQVAAIVETAVSADVADSVEERLETEVDNILDALESDLDVDEGRIESEQWLVMAEPEVFEELAAQGYLFDAVADLPALGMRLAEVAAPSSFDITEVRRGVLDVVGKDRAEVDLNHIYTAGADMEVAEAGVTPRSAFAMPAAPASNAPRIGMIDSQVDTSHPSLAQSNIESRSFVSAKAVTPAFHGTAIASIIAANSMDYQGLAPDAQVFAAGVFEEDAERGEIASTFSLLRALDWLISSDVDVVNISLAGPPNRLLQTALERAAEQQVLVLAAAGNGGPVAQPMYPAAYDTVVAVTAVDTRNQVFRLANRGAYLDIAAPGVGLMHARAGGGYAASSGTSFAVPFAATAAASLARMQPGEDVMSLLYRAAQDLGPPGRDEIYGHGLLRYGDS